MSVVNLSLLCLCVPPVSLCPSCVFVSLPCLCVPAVFLCPRCVCANNETLNWRKYKSIKSIHTDVTDVQT